jgi:hypothetical protein
MPNYKIFKYVIEDEVLSSFLAEPLQRDVLKLIYVSRRLRALYTRGLNAILSVPLNTRLDHIFSVIMAPLDPEEKLVRFSRDITRIEATGSNDDFVQASVKYVSENENFSHLPLYMAITDFDIRSYTVLVRFFNISLKHMAVYTSRESIPKYVGLGEDPQDRSVKCFPTDHFDEDHKGIGKWLVLHLDGQQWVGEFTYYNDDKKSTSDCMFAFTRTPKGAYSALLMIRAIINHVRNDICPPIPLFRN